MRGIISLIASGLFIGFGVEAGSILAHKALDVPMFERKSIWQKIKGAALKVKNHLKNSNEI